MDWNEAIADVPQVINFIQAIQKGLEAAQAKVKAAPESPGGPPLKPYFELAAAVLPEFGALVDLVKTQAAT